MAFPPRPPRPISDQDLGCTEGAMSTETNRRLIADAMAAMAAGDTRPFGALMHEDFVWTAMGANSCSGVYRGREAVRTQLLAPLFKNFASTYTNRPVNILADGDFVVVEARAHAMTHLGKPYDHAYCFVIRMREGLMVSLVEYLDAELVANALMPRDASCRPTPPPRPSLAA